MPRHPRQRRTASFIFASIALGALFAGLLFALPRGHAEANEAFNSPGTGNDRKTQEQASREFGKLPLSFVENKGQTDARVKFMSNGSGYSLFLTANEAVLVLARSKVKAQASDSKAAASKAKTDLASPASEPPAIEQRVLSMELVGANKNLQLSASDELPGKINYLIGSDSSQWQTNLPTFAKVHYEDVYPGINLIYYGNQRRLEYDFVVSPGADPRAIKLKFAGADRLRINDKGDLIIDAAGEIVTLHKPFLYQVADNGKRQEVGGRYLIKAGGQVTFDVEKFDAQKPLVIDPILVYSTEIGSNGHDSALSIAVDSSGSAYITGSSNGYNFPTTPGALKPSSTGNAFVTKLNPAGTALVYSTYLGGSSFDTGYGIAVDASGNAYLAGSTDSSNFPTVNPVRGGTANLLRSADAGESWGGQNIGSLSGPVSAFAVDPVAPDTIYAGGDFNNTGGILKSVNGGKTWVPLNPGIGNVACSAIVIDPSTPSTIYASLVTNNSQQNGVYKSVDGGNSWVNVSSGLNSSISALAIDPKTPTTLYAGASFLGMYKSTNGGATWASSTTGLNYAGIASIVVDPVTPTTIYASAGGGGVFKSTNGGANWAQTNTGLTHTTVQSLAIDPTSPSIIYAGTNGGGVFKSTNGGGNWAAVNTGLPANTIVSSLGLNASAPTTLYLGTTNGRIYKTVNGASSWSKVYETLSSTRLISLAIIPGAPSAILVGAHRGSSSTDYEGFVSKLNAQGSALIYSTYLGGIGSDLCQSIAVDSGGNAYVTGRTASASFILANAFQSTLKGQEDAFVAKFDPAGALSYSTYLGGSSQDSGYGIAVDSSGSAYLTGITSSTDYPSLNPIAGATGSVFVTKFNQAGTGLIYSTRLGNGTGYAIAVDDGGSAYVTGSAYSEFPTTAGAFQTTFQGGCCSTGADDVFVSKLNPAGSQLTYSTYLGGAGSETGRGIALDSSGNAYIAGFTNSIDYPLAAGALRTKSPFFKSDDAGANWRNDSYGIKGDTITTLALDPKSPSTIYAGTRTGVFKSTDGGTNWKPINSGLTMLSISKVVVDPLTPSTLYLAAYNGFSQSGSGVYKSTNGGQQWTAVNNGLTNLSVQTLAIDPVSPATLYVGTYGGPIFKSIDGAATWTRSSDPQTVSFVISIAINPATPTTIYAAADMSSGGIFKSTDGGSSWQRTGGPLMNGYGRSVAVNPANPAIVFASGNNSVIKSTDGGDTWSLVRNQSAVIVFDPINPSNIYLLSFDGIQKSTDGGANWSAINNGLTYLNPFSLVVNPLKPSIVYVGSQASTSSTETFVTKLNANGTALHYSTLIGSSQGMDVAIDSAGAAYVTGLGALSVFPVTPDAFQPFNAGFTDAFVTKLALSYLIGGQVLDSNGAPVSNAEVTLSGSQLRSVSTGSDGTYQFSQLPEGGSFTVSVAQPHYTFTPPSQTFNNLNSNQTANFTAATTSIPFYTISGHVAGVGNGLSNVAISLSGSQVGSASTDSNGNYSFTVASGGSYTVTPSVLGFNLTPGTQTFNNLSADQTADFAATRLNFTVTNTNDHGTGSLRQAILDANATIGADVIVFNIPGAGAQTIKPRYPLPDITDPVTIDGTTQPGFAASPLIELNGESVTGDGLRIAAGNCTVRGLVINSFKGYGIRIESGVGHLIQTNYIGLDPTGSIKRPNLANGISVFNSTGTTIGGTSTGARNVISGNAYSGIEIGTSSSNNLIQGNYIGLSADGRTIISNNEYGILLNGTSNTVGGSLSGAGNVITGSGRYNIQTNGTGHLIQGNFIGTDATGTFQPASNISGGGIMLESTNTTVGGTTPEARNIISGNPGSGIVLASFISTPNNRVQGNFIGTDVTGKVALGNSMGISTSGSGVLIGGSTAGAGNLISGNKGAGIQLNCCGGGYTVQGNLIGTDVTGNVAIGNGQAGIYLSTGNNLIGGTIPGARNIISGNQTGIQIKETISNTIQGNYIGTNLAGNAPVPNSSIGVEISFASNNQIGGANGSAGNVIAFNGGQGIFVNGNPGSGFGLATGNAIRRNSIFSNAKMAIDLAPGDGVGVTLNDAADVDTGGNNLQNFPVITSVTSTGGGTTIQGTLNSVANKTYDIDFYSNASCDASGNGEGARFLNSTQVTTDASGNAQFNVTFPETLAANRVVTATATDPSGNTSEFSACNSGEAVGSVEFSAAGYNVLEDVGSASVTIKRTGGSKGQLAVNYSTEDETATAGADYTAVSGTLVFADGETSKTFSVPVANDGITEPDETLRLTLGGVADVELLGAHSSVKMTIQANSTPLTLIGEFVTVTEGSSGTTNAMVTVNLSAATGRTVVASYNTAEGNIGGSFAQAGTDYQHTTGQITFAPGVTSQTLTVPIIGDTLDEFEESFFVILSSPDGGPPVYCLITIVDDDEQTAAVSINDVKVVEGNAGTTNAVFTLKLSSASGKFVRVNFTTANGTATAGSDYRAANAPPLFFNPGETTKTLTVQVNGDVVDEPDETFFVNLTSALNANIALSSGKGTILNDDGSPTSPRLILDESGPDLNQAAALDSLLLLRDPFPVLSEANWWTQGDDHNTRVILFVSNLQLAAGESASAVTINLVDSNNQIYDVVAQDLRTVPDHSFTQVVFRLPDTLAPGTCTIKVKVNGQESNSGTIRIRS